MNNQQRRPPELIPCPGCKGDKEKGKAVCYNCRKRYVAEAADLALAGKPVPTYEEWIEKMVQGRIPALQDILRAAQEDLSTAQRKAEEKLQQLLAERVPGQLEPEILEMAKTKLKEKEGDRIWRGIDGPRIYRAYKIAGSRLQEAQRLLQDLEAKKTSSPLLEYGEKILESGK
jgi:transcription elongation factor Elf1